MTTPQVIQFPVVSVKANISENEAQREKSSTSTGHDLDAPHPVTGLKYGGYIPLRCLIFMPEILAALNPGETVLFLYLTFLQWRYPSKGGCVRAALPYLAKGTGIGRTAVHAYLGRLETLGFIECLEKNHKLGNLYKIRDLAVWNETKAPELPQQARAEAPQQKSKGESLEESLPTHRETAEVSELRRFAEESSQLVESSQLREGKVESSPEEFQSSRIRTTEKRTTPVQNPDDCSSDSERHPSGIRTKELSSLSFSILSHSPKSEIPESILNYFESIRAYRKREKEEKHFLRLKKSFSLNEISEALDFLIGYGLRGSGEACHSPMAYLAEAMAEVLRAVQAEKAKTLKAELQKQQAQQAQRETETQNVDVDREIEIRNEAFAKAFPSLEAQAEYIREFSKIYPVLGAGQAARAYAIQKWFSDRNQ